MRPSRDSPRFVELLHFMSHVAACYPEVRTYSLLVFSYVCVSDSIRPLSAQAKSSRHQTQRPPHAVPRSQNAGVRLRGPAAGVPAGGLGHRHDPAHAPVHGPGKRFRFCFLVAYVLSCHRSIRATGLTQRLYISPTNQPTKQALILLRNRGMLEPNALLRLVFRLFAVPDKGACPCMCMIYMKNNAQRMGGRLLR